MNRLAIALSLLAGIVLAVGWFWREKPAPQLETGPTTHLTSVAEQLNRIIIPDYPTQGITLEEAVEQLRLKIREFGISVAESSSKSVNIVIIAGGDRKLPPTSGLTL